MLAVVHGALLAHLLVFVVIMLWLADNAAVCGAHVAILNAPLTVTLAVQEVPQETVVALEPAAVVEPTVMAVLYVPCARLAASLPQVKTVFAHFAVSLAVDLMAVGQGIADALVRLGAQLEASLA